MDPVSRAQLEIVPQNRHKIDPTTGTATQFKPGNRANPGGRPKKARVTKIYEKIFASAKNRKEIEQAILETLLSRRMSGVLLLREAAERIEGKVTQELEVNVMEQLTDEQLKERLEAKLA